MCQMAPVGGMGLTGGLLAVRDAQGNAEGLLGPHIPSTARKW